MPSGSLSVGGTCTIESLWLPGEAGAVGIEPVMSLDEIGEAAARAAVAGSQPRRRSSAAGAELLSDCRPIGVGEVIEGVTASGVAGLAPSSAGGWAEGGGSLEFSIAGICGALPPSSSVIAILKVPSTITTTLAPTSSERILEVMVEGSLALSPASFFSGSRLALVVGGAAAAAAWAARRAAAMKLEVLTGSPAAAGISLIALSEAAMRSDGEAARPLGRVPGSSG